MESSQTISLENQNTCAEKGISGSTIKIIAIVAMLIDHIAAVILGRILMYRGYGIASMNSDMMDHWMSQGTNAVLLISCSIMRLIGRFGFPIFCFLLIEGFVHTRSRKKYALRLFLFCLISEIPFDLAMTGKWYYPSYQNVFFTLFIGFLAMCGYDYVQKHTLPKWLSALLSAAGLLLSSFYPAMVLTNLSYNTVFAEFHDVLASPYLLLAILLALVLVILLLCLRPYHTKHGHEQTQKLCICMAVLFSAMLCADLLQTDYSGMGVLTISLMYAFRHDRIKSMLAGCITLTVMSLMEATAFLMLIPISKYNGKRGLNIKYFFYAFYPVHLALLFLICKLMGVA